MLNKIILSYILTKLLHLEHFKIYMAEMKKKKESDHEKNEKDL